MPRDASPGLYFTQRYGSKRNNIVSELIHTYNYVQVLLYEPRHTDSDIQMYWLMQQCPILLMPLLHLSMWGLELGQYTTPSCPSSEFRLVDHVFQCMVCWDFVCDLFVAVFFSLKGNWRLAIQGYESLTINLPSLPTTALLVHLEVSGVKMIYWSAQYDLKYKK